MSSPPPRAHIAISPTTPAHLPALAACELLAFSGAFPPPCPFMHRFAPFRAPLVRAGVPPELWPDFAGTGEARVVGMALMRAPRTEVERARRARGWTERVLGDYVYPAVGSMRARVGQEADGKDYAFLAAFRRAQAQTFAALMRADDFYLQGLFVHPSFQRRGAGSALLVHCARIADAARAPLVLEAVPAGVPLYAAHGFARCGATRVVYRGELVAELPFMRREAAAGPPLEAVEEDGMDRYEDAGENAGAS